MNNESPSATDGHIRVCPSAIEEKDVHLYDDIGVLSVLIPNKNDDSWLVNMFIIVTRLISVRQFFPDYSITLSGLLLYVYELNINDEQQQQPGSVVVLAAMPW